MEINILGLARHGLNAFEQWAIVGVLITAFISLAYAWILRGVVLKKDKGTEKMQEVWNAIRVGADSYLNRQLKTILPAIVLLGIALYLSVAVVPPSREAVARVSTEYQNHHCHRKNDSFYYGCYILPPRWTTWNAYGYPGKCSGCFCSKTWI